MSSRPIQNGFWACTDIAGCCYNNNGSMMDAPSWMQGSTPNPIGGRPKGANLAINFSGMTGINQVNAAIPPYGEVTRAEVPACKGMDHCWLNLGGGRGGNPSIDHPVTLDGFKSLIKNAKKIKDLGYTGVSFDYENDDPDTVLTYGDWEDVNEALQKEGLDTALTMATAGLGVGTKFGYNCTPAPGDKKCNIAKNIPFTYNIPQLYGGYPMFYTGEYNEDWKLQNPPFTGYDATRPQCTGKPEASGDHTNCVPIQLLCDNMHPGTQLLPSFGGQAPGQEQFDNIAKYCTQWSTNKPFISWNITDPTTEVRNPDANNCLVQCKVEDNENVSNECPAALPYCRRTGDPCQVTSPGDKSVCPDQQSCQSIDGTPLKLGEAGICFSTKAPTYACQVKPS